MTVDLVIFDCDGVLIDSEGLASQVVCETLRVFGLSFSPEEINRRFAGFTDRDIAVTLARETGRPLPDDFPQQVARRAMVLFERELQVVAGVEAVLTRLKHDRCVASNSGPARLEHALRITGLRRHFPAEAVFSAAQVAASKPAPDLHLHAAAVMRANPAHCLVIEDSVTGIAAACAAGMIAFGFTGASHTRQGQADRLRVAGAREVAGDMEELWGLLSGL